MTKSFRMCRKTKRAAHGVSQEEDAASQKEDADIDNDGDKDSSDKYLAKRRKAIGKAMKKEEVEQMDEAIPAMVGAAAKTLSGLAKGAAGSMAKKAVTSKPKEDEMEEGYKPMPFERMEKQSGEAYKKEQEAAKRGDEKETNKQMQRRIAMKSPLGRKQELMKKNMKEEHSNLFSDKELEALAEALGEIVNEGASNPFQVHFDKDGKEYTSKGTKEERDRIAKNIASNKKREPDPYRARRGESD